VYSPLGVAVFSHVANTNETHLITDRYSAYQPHPLVNVTEVIPVTFSMLTVQLLMSTVSDPNLTKFLQDIQKIYSPVSKFAEWAK